MIMGSLSPSKDNRATKEVIAVPSSLILMDFGAWRTQARSVFVCLKTVRKILATLNSRLEIYTTPKLKYKMKITSRRSGF